MGASGIWEMYLLLNFAMNLKLPGNIKSIKQQQQSFVLPVTVLELDWAPLGSSHSGSPTRRWGLGLESPPRLPHSRVMP